MNCQNCLNQVLYTICGTKIGDKMISDLEYFDKLTIPKNSLLCVILFKLQGAIVQQQLQHTMVSFMIDSIVLFVVVLTRILPKLWLSLAVVHVIYDTIGFFPILQVYMDATTASKLVECKKHHEMTFE